MTWWGWVLIAAALVLAYGMTFARWRFVIHHSEAHVLPKGAKAIRVLHISDVHMAPWQKRKQAFIKSLMSEAPDLIINTGDNLGHQNVIHNVIDSYSEILKVPGVFVNGSNDYYAPRIKNPFGYLRAPSTPGNSRPLATNELTNAFENHGWKDLNNRSAEITINGTKIGFIGVDDPHDKLDDLSTCTISPSYRGIRRGWGRHHVRRPHPWRAGALPNHWCANHKQRLTDQVCKGTQRLAVQRESNAAQRGCRTWQFDLCASAILE
jgi:predicted MPP superfamily phosphohydrolase